MASTMVQLRVEEQLKTEASDIFEQLGLDLSSAIRIFLTRAVQEKGIPFSMKLNTPHYESPTAVEIMKDFSNTAKNNGLSNMSLEDINAEISTYRKGL